MVLLQKWSQASWSVKTSLTLMCLFLAAILFAPWIAPYDPNATNLLNNNLPPVLLDGSWAHPLGTDQLGRDLLSRMIYGLRTSVGIAALGLVIGCAVGVIAGIISGYVGGLTDKVIMALVDFQMAVPYTLILLMGIVLFGTDTIVLIALISLANWENYARMIRGLVLAQRSQPYIENAQAAGASGLYVIFRHIVPGVIPTVLVMLTMYFPSILTMESSLSFLGIGVQPPTASLGRMVGDGRNYLMTSWWIAIIPSLLIMALALTIQTIADWFRNTTDMAASRD